MDKIIVNIIGGVGNQLFQYATGYAVAKNANLPLYLDLSGYENYKLRNFELENFCLDVNIASSDDIKRLNKKSFFNKTLYKDKKKTFNPSVLKIKKPAYLTGYWQSEKYFAHLREDLLNLFAFKNCDFAKNGNLLCDIKNSNSVAICLRLGDYLTNEENRRIYFVCKKKYYENALNYITQRLGDDLKFYVFSDDVEGAKEFLPEGFEYNFTNSLSWREDLFYMQNVKHNIIANSSFAWWAAWLNQNPNKIVIAPKNWYTSEAKINDKDVVPSNWVKIDTN